MRTKTIIHNWDLKLPCTSEQSLECLEFMSKLYMHSCQTSRVSYCYLRVDARISHCYKHWLRHIYWNGHNWVNIFMILSNMLSLLYLWYWVTLYPDYIYDTEYQDVLIIFTIHTGYQDVLIIFMILSIKMSLLYLWYILSIKISLLYLWYWVRASCGLTFISQGI